MLFQALINFLKFFLCLCLVRFEIILLLKFAPNFDLVNEVRKDRVHLLKGHQQMFFLIYILERVAVHVDQKFIGVDVLWQRHASQQHVHKVVDSIRVKVALKELQVLYELLVGCDIEAFHVLLLEKLKYD